MWAHFPLSPTADLKVAELLFAFSPLESLRDPQEFRTAFVVTPLMDGNLYNFRVRYLGEQKISHSTFASIAHQLLSALAFLHFYGLFVEVQSSSNVCNASGPQAIQRGLPFDQQGRRLYKAIGRFSLEVYTFSKRLNLL